MKRRESSVAVGCKSGRGSALVFVEDDGDRRNIQDIFSHWPAAHLRVLAAGIDDLLGMKAAARKALADRETRRQVWEDAHPGRSYPTQRKARAIAAA